jgi:hypothetical protein
MSRRKSKACRPASGPLAISTSTAQLSRLAPPVNRQAAVTCTGACTVSVRKDSNRVWRSLLVSVIWIIMLGTPREATEKSTQAGNR